MEGKGLASRHLIRYSRSWLAFASNFAIHATPHRDLSVAIEPIGKRADDRGLRPNGVVPTDLAFIATDSCFYANHLTHFSASKAAFRDAPLPQLVPASME
jgi:hypothetical protein